ncbi:hypothetical protein PSI23_16000 [Xenorhabdus sp. XENO-10]|uniref:Uncharacterized protein n=1 Tax=Xenorhabdus yunnanensis TaxID=3025878 RepID=A0ABT5LI04_9GAMM|nr:hypothetical protein [Xenorhabdus yunnanensis]MDC9590747.1 hypothetical protein [Xenorhabdus yunnanensis]
MLLGGMTSFPIGKSLKFVGVGVVLTVFCFGGYLVHGEYKSLTNDVTELNKAKSALTNENKNLKVTISTQDENIRLLNGDIAARDSRLNELEETQKNLENKFKKQREESYDAIEQFKKRLANSQCANQRMPDDIIRLQRQRTAEFNKLYGG